MKKYLLLKEKSIPLCRTYILLSGIYILHSGTSILLSRIETSTKQKYFSYERESIFSIGLTASLAMSASTSTVGQPNFKAL